MRRLITLLGGLPDDARSTLPDPTDTPWGMVEELLAQLVELTAVYASERRLKEPFTVPRPAHLTPAGQKQTARKPATGPDSERTTAGLGEATSQMAAWAARNGGVGGNGAALLGYPTAPVTVGGEPDA